MPELPEVETIKRGLSREIVGSSISEVTIDWSKSFPATPDQIQQFVVGQSVKRLERRSKVLIWDLTNDWSLMFHLKMTGQLVLVRPDGGRLAGGHPSESMAAQLPDRSTRVIFRFGNGEVLYFNDQRKFGWIKLVPTAEVGQDALVARLGPEPLSPDFTLEAFKREVARHPGAPVKAIILDQSTVSGVGNIYADESLHLAKIHPSTVGAALSQADIKRLHEAIRTIIGIDVEQGGTSFAHYVNSLGGKGDYLQRARVFRREGQGCPVCGQTIVKLRVAGRGTHICPKCQRLKGGLR